MNTRTQIRLLYFLAASFFAGGVLWLVDGLFLSDPIEAVDSDIPNSSNKNESQPTSFEISHFENLWSKRLQGPPREPKPIEPVAIKEPDKPKQETKRVANVKPPSLLLMATINSQVYPMATFEVDNNPVSVTIGETIKGAVVEKIEPKKVTLRYKGLTFEEVIE